MALKKDLFDKSSKSIQFLKTDIWRLRANKLTGWKATVIPHLRVFLLAISRFYEDKCELRASALTFYSLLSIVPVVAMAFGVAKGFGLEKVLQEQLVSKLEGQQETAEKIIGFANTLLETTKGGAIAGVGVVVLFWTVVKVLSNIENSFNDIWGIKKARQLGRKLADYLSLVMICPVLLIAASSITVILTTQITAMVERLSILGHAAGIIIFLLRILPYAVIWVLFTFIYVFMPNTKVHLKSGLWAGIIAGTIYQLAQFAYIKFQIGVASYGAIYGSFAALPLFLVWLQLSWVIVLFGAEIAFAHQNVEAYEFVPDCLKVSQSFKRIVALIITHHCVKEFLQAKRVPSADDISHELEIPIRLVRSILYDLTETKILSEVCTNEVENIGYQPGTQIDDLTVEMVSERLDQQGTDSIPIVESKSLERIRDILRRFHEMNNKSPMNLKIQEL
jgi:membrane protein